MEPPSFCVPAEFRGRKKQVEKVVRYECRVLILRLAGMETARLAPLFIIFLRSLIPFVKNVTIYGLQHFSSQKYIIPAGQARFLMVNTLTGHGHSLNFTMQKKTLLYQILWPLGKSIRLPQTFLSLLQMPLVPDFCLYACKNIQSQLSMFGLGAVKKHFQPMPQYRDRLSARGT
jgi:hypothetical protein